MGQERGSTQSTWSPNTKQKSGFHWQGRRMGRGAWLLGRLIWYAELYIHLLCAVSCPFIYLCIDWSACLLVCQSCLEIVCLIIHVSLCVYLYVYLFVFLFVFWSVYVSLHQFVCLVSISICLCPSIHLEFLSTTALLSPITYSTNG